MLEWRKTHNHLNGEKVDLVSLLFLGDVHIDNEMHVVILLISRVASLIFEGSHRSRICVRAITGVSVRAW